MPKISSEQSEFTTKKEKKRKKNPFIHIKKRAKIKITSLTYFLKIKTEHNAKNTPRDVQHGTLNFRVPFLKGKFSRGQRDDYIGEAESLISVQMRPVFIHRQHQVALF